MMTRSSLAPMRQRKQTMEGNVINFVRDVKRKELCSTVHQTALALSRGLSASHSGMTAFSSGERETNLGVFHIPLITDAYLSLTQ